MLWKKWGHRTCHLELYAIVERSDKNKSFKNNDKVKENKKRYMENLVEELLMVFQDDSKASDNEI